MGYGDYDGKVGINKLNERYTWSAGRWIHVSRCFLLEAEDNLEVMEDVVDSSQERHVMDEDVDAIVRIGLRQSVILVEYLEKLTLQ